MSPLRKGIVGLIFFRVPVPRKHVGGKLCPRGGVAWFLSGFLPCNLFPQDIDNVVVDREVACRSRQMYLAIEFRFYVDREPSPPSLHDDTSLTQRTTSRRRRIDTRAHGGAALSATHVSPGVRGEISAWPGRGRWQRAVTSFP